MIVKMKRYSFLIFHRQYEDFLIKLRETGVLHVLEKQEGIEENDLLRERMQLASQVKSAIAALESTGATPRECTEYSNEEAFALLQRIGEILEQKESLSQKKHLIEREAERMLVWGDYSTEALTALRQQGINLHFFSTQISRFKPEWSEQYELFIQADEGGARYFTVILSDEQTHDIDAEPVVLNAKNAAQLLDEARALENQLSLLDEDLYQLAEAKTALLRLLMIEIEGNIDLIRVQLSTRAEVSDKVMLLQGYCPEPAEKELEAMLEASGVYYEVANPDIEEAIPIKLKNSKFSKLFEPITELFSLPNYSELDPTPFLAPFFMLFFGLCLGDGGYGLLIWLAATLLKPKVKANMKGLLTLGQYLGLATLVVGILTGSVFGIALDQMEWKWLAGVKQYFITEGNYADKLGGYNPMMVFAVVIGVIQILFGMMVKVMKVHKQHGFSHAVGHLAWVVFIVGLIIFGALNAFEVLMPIAGLYILYIIIGLSVGIILFYNTPGKNIFLNFGSALWNTYNMATGLLGDTLSYIRLFALGLTGSILGGVFNTLAFDLTSGVDPLVRWLVVLLILLVGHSINFALCLIGAFVHPIRLTFVEFYKNAGFEGGGKAYKPFQVKK
jgi:V/A-type H+/Na+-transporting ATPase subunit I